MLLSIDEVINMTPDQTIIVFGQSANVFDLPANAQSQGNFKAFTGWPGGEPFVLQQGPWLIAPSTTGDTEPDSVKLAKELFARAFFAGKSIAYWPIDITLGRSIVPAYKQALVTTAFTPQLNTMQATSTWIFVVSSTGDITAQVVQLLTYQAVQANGQIQVGPNTALSEINQGWGPDFANQEPPDFSYALNTITWKIKAGAFDYQTVLQLINRPEMGYYYSSQFPPSWGQGVSQTTLLSAPSTPFDVDWTDSGGEAKISGFTPSSPILHISLLAGSALTFKRPWLQDYAANLIAYTPSAASSWDDILACSLLVFKIIADISGDLPWPAGGIVDYCFDEAMEHVDPGFTPPIPPWLQ